MTALLEVHGVSKRFGGHDVVDDVSLTIEHGEAVGLIGANGAGKTTLFRMIAGELPLSAGSISFEGSPLPPRMDARARRGIARTFQLVELFGGLTVLDHLLVALQAHDGRQGRSATSGRRDTFPAERIRCDEVLDLCGLRERADEPATALSLGERRAVEARQSAHRTSRARCSSDEPSSGTRLR